MKEYKGFRADRLREVMEKHEATLNDIADGLSKLKSIYPRDIDIKSYVNKIINGSWEPGYNTLLVICEVCNCTSDYLLGLSDEI